MGTIQHNAILATTFSKKVAEAIDEYIRVLPDDVRPLFFQTGPTDPNSYYTFVMTPDGSKEGWPESDRGDDVRTAFIAYLRTFDYEEDSSPIAYLEVGYGEYGPQILRGNTKDRFV